MRSKEAMSSCRAPVRSIKLLNFFLTACLNSFVSDPISAAYRRPQLHFLRHPWALQVPRGHARVCDPFIVAHPPVLLQSTPPRARSPARLSPSDRTSDFIELIIRPSCTQGFRAYFVARSDAPFVSFKMTQNSTALERDHV